MKYNPKIYQEKERIYMKVPNTNAIQRMHHWNGSEYVPGKYEARRYDEMKKRIKRAFDTLAEARNWQAGKNSQLSDESENVLADKGMNFGAIIREWQMRVFPTLNESTCLHYEKMIRLYIERLAPFGIYELTPKKIDCWIDELKATMAYSIQCKNRKSFKHELTVLNTILSYYQNYYDDLVYRCPIKKRHRLSVKLAIPKDVQSKDLSETEFRLFTKQFVHIKNGDVYVRLAILQFYQALRISEASGCHWEDMHLNAVNPSASRIKIVRSAFWPRRKNMPSSIRMGFKNAKANDGLKELPMFPETYAMLMESRPDNAKGLVFTIDGTMLEYRSIHHAYRQAFKLAGLPYTATHIMRHGGTRRLYNERGDLAVAAQLLGNSDIETVMVYAKREKSALTEVSNRHWAEYAKSKVEV